MTTNLIDVSVEAPPVLAQPLVVPADQPATLVEQFGALFAQAEEWRQKAHAIRVTDVSQKAEMKLARESRLALRQIRCSVENRRKELKEEALRTSQTIDGIARVFRNLVEPIEVYLEKQETFVERFEAAQREARQSERALQLTRLEFAHAAYDLGAMPEEQFAALLELAEKMKASREEVERKAEQERVRKEIEEAEERRRTSEALAAARIEAEKARAEADRREAEFRVKLKEQEEAARKARAEAERVRREAEAKAAEERRLAKIESDRIEAEERSKREAAEAEARRLREAEEQRVREEQRKAKAEADRAEALAKAGDKEKLAAFASTIRNDVIASAPVVKSKSAKAALMAAMRLLSDAVAELER